MAPTVILYCYPFSPFAQKVALVLALKRIPFRVVSVTDAPPRPALEALGITYRRIPVLSIDGDFFLDTSLIIEELEKRFPSSEGFETLWPGSSKSLAPLLYGLSHFWADKPVFQLAAALLPSQVWKNETFRKDRESFLGTKLDAERLKSMSPNFTSSLQSHLQDLESQLQAISTPFLLGDKMSLIDISFYGTMNWLRGVHFSDKTSNITAIFGQKKEESSIPKVLEWMSKMDSSFREIRKNGLYPNVKGPIGGEMLKAEEAQKMIEGFKKMQVRVDGNDSLIRNGWLKKGEEVIIVPDDTGKVPQAGSLVGLTSKTGTLALKTSNNQLVHLHFPRLGFNLMKAQKGSKL